MMDCSDPQFLGLLEEKNDFRAYILIVSYMDIIYIAVHHSIFQYIMSSGFIFPIDEWIVWVHNFSIDTTAVPNSSGIDRTLVTNIIPSLEYSTPSKNMVQSC